MNKVKFGTTEEVPIVRTRRSTQELAPQARQAQLVVLVGTGRGRRYRLAGDTIIGRDPNASVWLPDDRISRRHARISEDKGEYLIEDLTSANGTYVNGIAVRRQELVFGDRITLGGGTVLVFTYADPLEEQLVQTQKMETAGRLAAGIAHEFNNLLGVVIGNLTLLRDGLIDGDEQTKSLAEALEAATRGAELSRQMLDFSRASRSQSEVVEIGELLADIERFARRAFEPSVEISVAVDAGPGGTLAVRGDRMQLYQALMNLCLNARDALRKRGAIQLRASTTQVTTQQGLNAGEYVLIEVEDNGRGMPSDVAARAFEPFFTTKEVGQGTGLGLAVVHGIAHGHGGTVSLESEDGEGTTVKLLLPRVVEAYGRPPTRRLRSEERLRGRVLLADDNDLLLSSTARHLRAVGLEVLTASDGKEAVRILDREGDRIDLAILDVLMPVLGGAEAFPLMRKLVPDLPVILVSGHGADTNKVEGLLASGVSAFLVKPVAPIEMEKAIAIALGEQKG